MRSSVSGVVISARKSLWAGDAEAFPTEGSGFTQVTGLSAEPGSFRKLTDEAILCDALVSEDCSEWMNLMVRRISDVNELRCGNLAAVNFIVRGTDGLILISISFLYFLAPVARDSHSRWRL